MQLPPAGPNQPRRIASRTHAACLAACLLLSSSALLLAQDIWSGNAGNGWVTSGSWNNGTPTSTSNVEINTTGGPVSLSGTAASINSFSLDGNTLTITSGGSLGVTGDVTIDTGASSTNATLDVTTGTNSIGGTLAINEISGSYGTVNVSGGTLLINSLQGDGYLTINGGTTTLQGNSIAYMGIVSIASGGILNLRTNLALTGANLTLSGGTLQLQGGITIDNGLNDASGTLENVSGSNTYSGSITQAGALTVTSDSGTLTLTGGVNTTGNTLTLAGAGNGIVSTTNGIVDSGFGGSLVKNGSGTWTLEVANSYSGGTTVNAGTLRLFGLGTLGSTTGALTVNGGTLDLNGTNQTVGALSGTGGTITTTGTASTLTIDNGDISINSYTFGGTLADGVGVLALDKEGTGTEILTGANTYSGTTTISAGTLQIGNNAALGTGEVTFAGTGAVLQFGGAYSITNAITLTTDGIIDTQSNAATLSGAITGAGGLTKEGSGTLTLTNAGNNYASTTVSAGTLALSGSGKLSPTGAVSVASSAAFDITNSSSIIQTIGALSGAGEVTLGNNTLDVNTASTSTFSGQIIGNGGLVKEGTGTLVLSGSNDYLGGTAINAGTLQIDGSLALASSFNVNSGGTLRGSGSLGDATVTSGGTLAAGSASAIGTLTFSDLALQTGSTTILRVNSAASHDEIVSTGTLSLGGNLSLTLGGGLLNGDTVTLIQADGILSGSFASQTVTNNLNNALTFSLATITGAGGTVSVDVTAIQQSFTSFAQNPNQFAVAQLLNSVVGDSRESALISYLNDLHGTALPAAFTEISPIQQTAVAQTSLNVSRASFGTLENRLSAVRSGSNGLSLSQFNLIDQNIPASSLIAGTDLPTNVKAFTPAPDNRWGFFAAANGDFGDIDGGSLSPDSSYHGAGFTLGSDYRVTPALALGFAAGYDWNKTDFDDSGSNVVANSIRFGPYATWKDKGGDWIDGTLGGAYHWYESARDTLGGMADSHSNGTEFDTSLKYGHDFQAGAWTLTPTFGFDYLHLDIGDYTETGSLAPLTVDEQQSDSFRSNLGGTVAHAFKWKGVAWNPYVQAGWAHEFLDAADAVSARFASGAGDVFTTQGESIGHDSATFGAGLSAGLTDAVTANLSYSGEANGQYQDHSFDVSVRVQF